LGNSFHTKQENMCLY